MRLINMTPHPVVLRDGAGVDTTIPSSGRATAHAIPGPVENIEGIPVPVFGANKFGEIQGLPADGLPAKGALYLVSAVVGAAAAALVKATGPGQYPHVLEHLVVPGTGPADDPVRDEKGQVVAVKRLYLAVEPHHRISWEPMS